MANKEMEEKKPWYLSSGVIGSASAIIAGALGIWFTGIDKEQIELLLASAGGLVSGIIALIGRIKATKKIG